MCIIFVRQTQAASSTDLSNSFDGISYLWVNGTEDR